MKEKILNLKQKTNVDIKEIEWVVKSFPKENEKQLFDILYTHYLTNFGNREKTLKSFKKLLTK